MVLLGCRRPYITCDIRELKLGQYGGQRPIDTVIKFVMWIITWKEGERYGKENQNSHGKTGA